MPDPRPKYWWLTHFAVPLAILAASGLLFFALGDRPKPNRKSKVRQQELLVETVPVQSLGDELVIDVTGEVVPHREVTVSTEIGGQVVETSPRLRVGEFVSRGEVLVKIDPERLDLEIARLTTIRDQAESDLAQLDRDEKNLGGLIELARESHRLSALDRKRTEGLLAQSATSDAEVNLARKAELASRDALQRMENELRDIDARRTRLTLARNLASIQLKQAELDHADAVIHAPVSGVVIAAPIQDHAVLQAGQQIAVIEDTSKAEVHCHLTMDEMYWVWNHQNPASERHHSSQRFTLPSQPDETLPEVAGVVEGSSQPGLLASLAVNSLPAPAHVDATDDDRGDEGRTLPAIRCDVVLDVGGEDFIWNGTLARIDGAGLDPESRTIPCRVVVEQPARDMIIRRGPRTLMRGMFVTCRIRTRPDRMLFVVPEAGVRPGNQMWLNRDGRLHVASVRIVRVSDGTAVIDGDAVEFNIGDRLITSPVPEAREGLAVVETRKGTRKAAKTQRRSK